MDRARADISEFTGKHGHTTEVDEQIRPAVTEEVVRPEKLEERTTAIDREVHQHHHHTTVQPLEAKEVLPEQHAHRVAEVQQKEFRHHDEGRDRELLERERGQFQDRSTTRETQLSSTQAPTVEGEHVHHHVHETVQPVVNKETIQPEVVHTTVPIHETHHASTQHHGSSVLPTKTLEEFTASGGSLSGTTKSAIGGYDGVPKPYNQGLMTNPTEADRLPQKQGVEGPGSHHTGGTGLSGTELFTDDSHAVRNQLREGAGPGATTGATGTTGTTDYDNNTSSGIRSGNTGYGDNTTSGVGSGTTGYGDNTSSGIGSGTTGLERNAESELSPTKGHLGGVHTSDNSAGKEISGQNASDYESAKKPSLMDKINPLKKT